MLYELATLSCPLLAIDRASDGVYDWVNDAEAKGELFGCWRTEGRVPDGGVARL
jgi:hypothetical protein